MTTCWRNFFLAGFGFGGIILGKLVRSKTLWVTSSHFQHFKETLIVSNTVKIISSDSFDLKKGLGQDWLGIVKCCRYGKLPKCDSVSIDQLVVQAMGANDRLGANAKCSKSVGKVGAITVAKMLPKCAVTVPSVDIMALTGAQEVALVGAVKQANKSTTHRIAFNSVQVSGWCQCDYRVGVLRFHTLLILCNGLYMVLYQKRSLSY